ncbi:hypothetical protein EVAR_6355_1 [Eumeta japonica]|uniref:Uncharacterized protein n=1 Tax=Eumeta variegata TaxID=151549 RepID=A0A4C1TFU3_EUMVA|nr:hypothetical protein EVAR_6355_1 [Eumeta japonica]
MLDASANCPGPAKIKGLKVYVPQYGMSLWEGITNCTQCGVAGAMGAKTRGMMSPSVAVNEPKSYRIIRGFTAKTGGSESPTKSGGGCFRIPASHVTSPTSGDVIAHPLKGVIRLPHDAGRPRKDFDRELCYDYTTPRGVYRGCGRNATAAAGGTASRPRAHQPWRSARGKRRIVPTVHVIHHVIPTWMLPRNLDSGHDGDYLFVVNFMDAAV